MRKFLTNLLRFLFGRVFFYAVMILLQILTLSFLLVKLTQYSYLFLVLCYLISIVAVLALVSSDQNPSYKIAWIIAILAFPLLGGLFYLMLKLKALPKKDDLKHNLEANERLYRHESGAIAAVQNALPWSYTLSRYVTRTTGFPPYAGSAVRYFPLGDDLFPVLLDELRRAERFIFLEYFIIAFGSVWDEVLEILTEKVAAGVEVRILYDDIGSLPTMPRYYYRKLRRRGIKTLVFNRLKPTADPVMNYRDHRKICVVDGRVGFCGGINLADEYVNRVERFGHWKDTAVMLRGEAVSGLTRIFLQLWTLTSASVENNWADYLAATPVPAVGYVQPFPDDPADAHNVAESVYIQMINRADSYIYITTPYLILDNELTTALRTAAESGIDVRIITPGTPDKKTIFAVTRSNYLPLLHSGVKIYEYTPGFMHAKMAISDDCVALVGTANLDYRSLYLHYECAVALYDVPEIIAQIKADFLATLEKSRCISVSEMENRSLFSRIISAVLGLFSPLL